MYADLREGFQYLKEQPVVRALGITHSILMAGVVSANVVVVALTSDVLHAGARGLGYLESGWAAGAIVGGLVATQLRKELRLALYVAAFAGLALGHMAAPFVAFVLAASLLQVVFGFCRALGGVVAQASLMAIVPRHFMGRTQSAMAIVTTAVQLGMCVALGWIAEKEGIIAAYTLLALLYAGATMTAFHARQLLRAASEV
jgi:hypothetical protein